MAIYLPRRQRPKEEQLVEPQSEHDAQPLPNGISLRGVIAGVPDVVLAFTFLFTWVAPLAMGGAHAIDGLLLVMLMEFISIHASAFLNNTAFGNGSPAKKVWCLLGTGAFYALFCFAYSTQFHRWWPCMALAGMVGNRMLQIILGRHASKAVKQEVVRQVAVSMIFYLGLIFLTAILPLPALGITPDVVPDNLLPSCGDLWGNAPWRVLCFGFLYFSAQAYVEIFNPAWVNEINPQLK